MGGTHNINGLSTISLDTVVTGTFNLDARRSVEEDDNRIRFLASYALLFGFLLRRDRRRRT